MAGNEGGVIKYGLIRNADLSHASLLYADLIGIDGHSANSEADLTEAILCGAGVLLQSQPSRR